MYPDLRLDTEADSIQAHKMLGVAYLFENQPDNARREFKKLLELQPDFRFDPLLDSPRVVELFNQVLNEQQDELRILADRRKQRAAEERERQWNGPVLEHRIEKRSFALTLVPFGVGQFQNGQVRKGWFFMGVESGLAAVSVAAFVTNFALFGVYPRRSCRIMPMENPDGSPGQCPDEQVDRSDETLSRNLLRVQVATGAAFFGVAIWGIIDAVRNFQPEVSLGETMRGPAAPTTPAAPRAARTGPHVRLAPLLAAGTGASLVVVF